MKLRLLIMFNGWSIFGSSKPPSKPAAEAVATPTTAPTVSDHAEAVFLEALQASNPSVYEQQKYHAQRQYVSHTVLAGLLKNNATRAFCWVLADTRVNLMGTMQFQDETRGLNLLERAIQAQNSICAALLLQKNLKFAQEVSLPILIAIPKDKWVTFEGEMKSGAPQELLTAIEYLYLRRRIAKRSARVQSGQLQANDAELSQLEASFKVCLPQLDALIAEQQKEQQQQREDALLSQQGWDTVKRAEAEDEAPVVQASEGMASCK